MTLRIRILVVDDAREHAEMVVEFLRLSETWGGAQMDIATTYEQALDAMQRTAYDVAFFDYMLGARDGLALLRDVRGKGVETPVVVLTSRGAEDVAVEAMKAGAADYLSKVHLSIEALSLVCPYCGNLLKLVGFASFERNGRRISRRKYCTCVSYGKSCPAMTKGTPARWAALMAK